MNNLYHFSLNVKFMMGYAGKFIQPNNGKNNISFLTEKFYLVYLCRNIVFIFKKYCLKIKYYYINKGYFAIKMFKANKGY